MRLHGAQCRVRHGLTLVELIIATIIAAMLAGAVMVSVKGIVDSRNRSRVRQEAVQKVDSIVQIIAKDVTNLVRDSDLAASMLRITDEQSNEMGYDFDQLLLFSRSLRPIRPQTDQPEGGTYEVQYRIDTDSMWDSVLWRRRDCVPDEFYDGGGVAVPLATGVVSLEMEVFDGSEWFTEWDSDVDGIPYAFRVTCRAFVGETKALVWARASVPLDRVPPAVWLPDDDPGFQLFENPDDSGLFGGLGDDGDTGGDTGGGSSGGGFGGGGGGGFGGGG